ncbi:hypothetical protein HY572_00790 [Candidatus Micrarchaeota archaeon]|nr:hypothetical protein [Candidatus Micrarchaeota archaeon]
MARLRPHVPFSPEDLNGHIVLERRTALPPKPPEEPSERSYNSLIRPAMLTQGLGILAIAALIVLVVLMVLKILGVRVP